MENDDALFIHSWKVKLKYENYVLLAVVFCFVFYQGDLIFKFFLIYD